MMKKLLYKDIIGSNPRKHEVSIEETNNKVKTKISKRKTCKYFIKDHFTSQDVKELDKWLKEKQKASCRKDCHLMRFSDTRTGEEKILCKVLGDFFVVRGKTAYEIVFLNEIRLSVDDGTRRSL
ncbi:MAG: hypothetical protein ABIG55_05280 [Candidatus Omnitrophota bacterium]|nr:hypothetical protein [Candidatus Omnitrophota bacterium]